MSTRLKTFKSQKQQDADYSIMDSTYLMYKSSEKAAKETEITKILTWVSCLTAIIAAIAAIIPLLNHNGN